MITTTSRQITAPRVISARRNPVAWREDLASIDSERRQFRTEVQLCRRGFIRPRAEHPGRRSVLTRGAKEFHLQTLPPRLLPPERLVRRPRPDTTKRILSGPTNSASSLVVA